MCSLADHLQKPLAKLYAEGQKSTAINTWLENNAGRTVNRRTIYAHREHVKHPKDRLVTAVRKRQSQALTPASSSEEELLDTLVAIGNQRAKDDPDAITMDQVLKAVGLKQQSRQSKQGGIAILVATLTRPLEAPLSLALPEGIIDGEAVEVSDTP